MSPYSVPMSFHLKYVPDWHRRMRKAMDKYSFQESLGVVECPANASNSINETRRLITGENQKPY